MKYSEEFVFPMRYHTYNDKIKAAAKAIGLPPEDFRTHCLRATAATNLYQDCHDIKAVQHVLGHTTSAMTDKYIHNIKSLETIKKARETAMKRAYTLA